MKVVIGITGASGVVYGAKLLQVLRKLESVETHLIISKIAESVLRSETRYTKKDLENFADYNYDIQDLMAPISSGSFRFDAMVIVPCSMKTVAGLANGFTDNLILRTADVALKEKHDLIIVPRETPLSSIHLKNLFQLANIGVHILPAMPAFYHRPRTVDDMVIYVIGKITDALRLNLEIYKRWN